MSDRPRDLADLVERATALVTGPRVVLGIAGAPGSGKSTLALALVEALAAQPPPGMPTHTWVAHVPADGFHLADRELDRLGLRHRKGAPETFDAAGYAALLSRMVEDPEETVYAPAFERDLEQPVAGAIPVSPQVRLVVTEGNYLLLESDGWSRARDLMAQVWMCRPAEDRRRVQLMARHTAYGKDPQLARTWTLGSDEANAELVRASAHLADLVIGEELLRRLTPASVMQVTRAGEDYDGP